MVARGLLRPGMTPVKRRVLPILAAIAALAAPCGAALSGSYDFALAGPRVQGGLLQGNTAPDAEVFFDGEKVRVSGEGRFLIGFHRDEPREAVIKVKYADGHEAQHLIDVKPREYDIQRIDGLPGSMVSPSEENLKRIRKENATIRQARAIDDPREDFLSGFQWPAKGRISGIYGSQRILNGEPRRPHFGIDIAAPTGTRVVAPADGVVTLINPDMYFSGGTMILDHGHGLSSAFLHLSKITVAVGDRVRQGDTIAEVGATGRVTGAHLDWRVNLFGRRLDPQLLVGEMPQ